VVQALHVAATVDVPELIFKGGNIPVATGETNLQLGVVANDTVSPETFTPIQPVGGAVVAAPVSTPGGFLVLAGCPSSTPPLSSACNSAAKNPSLNDVQAIVRDAGNPSNLNVLAGAGVGQVIVTLPIKIQLDSPLLGGHCSIGSDANPIVLNIANTVAPTFTSQSFDANGTPDPNGVMGEFVLTGATQGDSTFAVPAATGCGPGGTADAPINKLLGLPSPSGNSLELDNATSYLDGFLNPSSVAPNDGKMLASAWHSATLP
jgi:hypothetical protein